MKYKLKRLVVVQVFLDEDFVKKSKREAKKHKLSFSSYLRLKIEDWDNPLPDRIKDRSGNGNHLTIGKITEG